RRRWVLYSSQAEHSRDYDRYPFEGIPRRIFIDTNVVNLLVRYAEQIFEQAPISADLDQTCAFDTEALMHIFQVGARASWDIFASRKTLEEVGRTPHSGTRAELLNFAVQLVD